MKLQKFFEKIPFKGIGAFLIAKFMLCKIKITNF